MPPRGLNTPRTPVSARTPTNVVGGEQHRRSSRKNAPTRRVSSTPRSQQPPSLTPTRSAQKRLPSKRLSASRVSPAHRPRRFRPGTRAIMEIRQLQRTTSLLIRRLPFTRLVKEVSQRYHHAMRYVESFHFG